MPTTPTPECFSIRSFGSFDGTNHAGRLELLANSFSIRSFGSFDGTGRRVRTAAVIRPRSFSIRSFGSFDGTTNQLFVTCGATGFSIRSFGSFDGTHCQYSAPGSSSQFQYPLFRII